MQSVARAFSLLDSIGREPASLTELARRVDLPVSTASRLLGTLEAVGAIERLDDVGLYRIGPAIVTMASSVDSSRSLTTIAEPELERLVETVGEAAGLSVPTGYVMHYIAQFDSVQPIQVQDWVGSRLPMHLVSSGLIVLAHWPSEAVDGFLERPLEGSTPSSITDADAIRHRLAAIRSAGLAWTFEELEVGINSVAAPVFNGSGEVVCALHIHGPAYRFPKPDRAPVEEALLGAAARLSEVLGPA